MKSYVSRAQWLAESSAFYKDELNPKFWQGEEFDPMVRTKLMAIAQDFYEGLQLEIPVEDVQLTGSIANYTWTDQSDLDVHVILDFTKVNEDKDLVKKALDGQRFMWNLRHPVVIKEHDVELYAQDMNEPHVSSGLFSLMKNEWIKKPVWNEPVVDELDVKRKVEAYVTEIDELEKMLADGTDSVEGREVLERVGALKSKIMKARKDGLAETGEFSVENLVFKQLRNMGWIERLIDAGSKAYSAIYSDGDAEDSTSPEGVGEKPMNENRIYQGAQIFVIGKETSTGKRLYLFTIDWHRVVERPGGWQINMVGLKEPRIVKRNDEGNLYTTSIAISSEKEMKRVIGLSSMSVALNTKTKTPFWHETITYTNVRKLLDDMKFRLPVIPGINLD
jgi:predicted nucleotidyltransferase